MKTRSKKAKGRRLQNSVAEKIRRHFNLSDSDVRPAIMGESGTDIKLSSLARSVFPFAVECKNSERLRLYEALEQAANNASDLTPALCFKRNRSDVYICLKFDDFLKILGGESEQG